MSTKVLSSNTTTASSSEITIQKTRPDGQVLYQIATADAVSLLGSGLSLAIEGKVSDDAPWITVTTVVPTSTAVSQLGTARAYPRMRATLTRTANATAINLWLDSVP